MGIYLRFGLLHQPGAGRKVGAWLWNAPREGLAWSGFASNVNAARDAVTMVNARRVEFRVDGNRATITLSNLRLTLLCGTAMMACTSPAALSEGDAGKLVPSAPLPTTTIPTVPGVGAPPVLFPSPTAPSNLDDRDPEVQQECFYWCSAMHRGYTDCCGDMCQVFQSHDVTDTLTAAHGAQKSEVECGEDRNDPYCFALSIADHIREFQQARDCRTFKEYEIGVNFPTWIYLLPRGVTRHAEALRSWIRTTISQRVRSDYFNTHLNLCAAQGMSFWPAVVCAALYSSRQNHFNLQGLMLPEESSWQAVRQRGKSTHENEIMFGYHPALGFTAWELYFVCSDPALRRRTTFWSNSHTRAQEDPCT